MCPVSPTREQLLYMSDVSLAVLDLKWTPDPTFPNTERSVPIDDDDDDERNGPRP